MKLAQINSVCNGSTGKIMKEIQICANENDFDTISFFGRKKGFVDLNCIKIGNNLSFLSHVLLSMIFGFQGCYSYFATKK